MKSVSDWYIHVSTRSEQVPYVLLHGVSQSLGSCADIRSEPLVTRMTAVQMNISFSLHQHPVVQAGQVTNISTTNNETKISIFDFRKGALHALLVCTLFLCVLQITCFFIVLHQKIIITNFKHISHLFHSRVTGPLLLFTERVEKVAKG